MSLINNSDELFTLIKSMSMSEKRYFKIIASKHVIGEKNNYIRLFEVLEKQKNYDEEAIRKKFHNKKFIKQLAVTKTYLYKLILKAMQGYNGQTSIDGELRGMLADVDFLYYKGLYTQSSKILKKVKSLAYKYEQNIFLLELLEKERRSMMEQGTDILKVEVNHAQLFNEKDKVLSKIKNTDQYLIIQDHLLMDLYKTDVNITEAEQQKYHALVNNPLLLNEQLATSSQSKIAFYNSNAFIHSYLGNLALSYKYRKKVLDYIESHPEHLQKNPAILISAYNNLIIGCNNQKKYDEALLHIHNLRKYKVDNIRLKAKIFETSYIAELHIYIQAGEYTKAMKIIVDVEKGLNTYKNQINKIQQIVFFLNIASVYIGVCRYNDAMIWNNKLLNDMEAGIRYDALSYSRIINLIIHYELKNYDQLEYFVKSTYRFLSKQKHLHKIEAIFLHFIEKKLPAINNKDLLIKSFSELKKELILISKKPAESYGLEYFDFISWLESKIENRSFAEIVKEKFSKKGLWKNY
ncbi:MAG: hypothetical protein H0W84_09185 [Bacteroidetes bacterium]|nr:hypothetical protein [Bacteroidota bacterium]